MPNFSQDQINNVWEKAIIMPNNNPDIFRQDYAGAWIRKDQYGRRDMPYGWEIDHCLPVAKGGGDELVNLYPLHWKNNAKKGDNFPEWQTELSSNSNRNVEQIKNWHIGR